MTPSASRTIILGAGLSGLYAAYLLKKSGRSVLVLEARHRLGGRVDTRTTADGLVYEMGAEWLGVKDTYMHALVKEMGLTLSNHRLATRFLHNGHYVGKNEWEPGTKLAALIRDYVTRFPSLSEDEIRRLQHTDWWHFLMRNGIPAEDVDLLNMSRSTDFGEDMRFVPTYDVLYDYSVGGDGDLAMAECIKGGNGKLAEALADRIGRENIILGVEVTEVQQTPTGVTAVGNGKTYEGSRLIATIPTLAVSRMKWSPMLPPLQQEAFDTITCCRVTKTAIEFNSRFWNDEAYELVTDRVPHQIYHATQGQPGKSGVLISYATGDRAYVMSRMSKAERTQEICDALATPFGNVLPHADYVATYYWGDDPYTGGAYTLFQDDERTSLQKLLRMPHGRVHFAGEHTAKRYGFMEGAVESGERVAEEVIRAGAV